MTIVPLPAGLERALVGGARHQLGHADVEPVHGAPALGLDRLGRDEVLPARVVDEQVEAAEALEHGVDHALGALGLAQVGGDPEDLVAIAARGLDPAAASWRTSSRRPAIATLAPQARELDRGRARRGRCRRR